VPVISAQGLVKVYGRRASEVPNALDGLDLTVEAGEFVGVMGPSGSGKTTLLNVLSTIDRPTSGHLTIAGHDALRLRGRELARFRREHLGFIFQDFNLLDALNLFDNIALPLALLRKPARQIERAVHDLAARFGIESVLHHHPHEVSGGQAQRAAAARALIHEPDVILADEPTGNLDSRAATDLLDSLVQAHRGRGATLLMVTHDPIAASFCERVVFIRDGRLFSQLHSAGERRSFYLQILDAMSAQGGVDSHAARPRFS